MSSPVTIQVEDDAKTLVNGGLDSYDGDVLLADGHSRRRTWQRDGWEAGDIWRWPMAYVRRLKRAFRSRTGSYSPDANEFRLTKGRRRSHLEVVNPWMPKRFTRFAWGNVLVLIVIGCLLVWVFRSRYELQLEIAVYSRPWIKQHLEVNPSGQCFDPSRISQTLYNISHLTSPKHHQLTTGLPLRNGMECFDFASTIQQAPTQPLEQLTYHTYWRGDLLPFEARQAATIKSFLATQPLAFSHLILWSNDVASLSSNPHIRHYLTLYPNNVELRQVDVQKLSRGTYLEGSEAIGEAMYDQRGWVDGDAVRLLVLWAHGGVWLDMDELLTRDLHSLTEHEFVTQWDCYDKPYLSLNGAVMHFRQHSPYLCEAFHIMSNSPRPPPNTLTWGAYLYQKLYHRLLANHITPFGILPWCFVDPRNCREDTRFPDPFQDDPEYWQGLPWESQDGSLGSARRELEKRVGQIWSIHLHNQWGKSFPKDGWVSRLLEGYDVQLETLEKYGRMESG